jgi:peptidoglycan/xylan/chitin deacetylase (PgdA/CDA1 family)
MNTVLTKHVSISSVFALLFIFAGCAIPVAHTHALVKKHTPSTHTSTSTPITLQKTVELTFDDGPYGTSTEQVLQILKQEQVQGTFFVMGQNVAKYPDQTREIVANGNVIGNHTYTHTNLSTISTGQALADIARAEATIASTTGIQTHLFRPPYGVLPKADRKALRAQGYRIIMWNDDPEDWNFSSSSKDQIVARVLEQKKGTAHLIVIFHDGRDTQINYPRTNMIEALPVVIEALKKQGYKFVTATSTVPS